MKATAAGDITTLRYLIQDNGIDVDTHGPRDYPWVS